MAIFSVRALIFFAACESSHAETADKGESGIFSHSVQSIIENAKKINHTEFVTLSSHSGILASRYYSAGSQNVNFTNKFTASKIPKTLDFSAGAKGAAKLTLPEMLEALKDSGATLDLAKCTLNEVNIPAFNFDAVLNNTSASSKAAQIAQHFYQAFSLDANARRDMAQVCITNTAHSRAYFGLISTPEDSDNKLIFGAALVFEKEDNQWRLRALAEFL